MTRCEVCSESCGIIEFTKSHMISPRATGSSGTGCQDQAHLPVGARWLFGTDLEFVILIQRCNSSLLSMGDLQDPKMEVR